LREGRTIQEKLSEVITRKNLATQYTLLEYLVDRLCHNSVTMRILGSANSKRRRNKRFFISCIQNLQLVIHAEEIVMYMYVQRDIKTL